MKMYLGQTWRVLVLKLNKLQTGKRRFKLQKKIHIGNKTCLCLQLLELEILSLKCPLDRILWLLKQRNVK